MHIIEGNEIVNFVVVIVVVVECVCVCHLTKQVKYIK